jgi:plastocyanin
MKKITLATITLIVFLSLSVIKNAYSTVWVITVQNYAFAPDSLTGVILGDTIRWQWVDGSHTTTSVTIPSGAEAWDSPMTDANPTFDYVPAVIGKYNYKCTPHAAFGMLGSFTVISSSGLNEQQIASLIQLSPNPFTDRITIKALENAPSIRDIQVYDLAGRMVFNKSFTKAENSMTVELGDLNKGVYFIRFRDEHNLSYTKKIIRN